MNIRSFPHFFYLLFLLCTVLMITSCEEEVPEVIIPPEAQNGLYLALENEYPNPFDRLIEEKVADPAQLDSMATPVAREGFVAGYMYLMAGNYQLVNVEEKEVVKRTGGTASIEEAGVGCGGDLVEYTLVQTDSTSSAAFPVNTAGFHKVTYDSISGELVVLPINDVSFIGTAVDTMGREVIFDEYRNLDATGGIWHKEEYEMFEGEWRVRFNCMHMIERGVSGQDPDYRFYTTLGGKIDSITLEAGGVPFVIGVEEVAAYNMDIVWYPERGWGIGPDMIEINPNDFRWQIDFEPYDEADGQEQEEVPYDELSSILYGTLFGDLLNDLEAEQSIEDANPDIEFNYLDKVDGKHEWRVDSMHFNPINFKLITIDSDGDSIPEGILVDRTPKFTGFSSNIPLGQLDNYLYYQGGSGAYRAPYKITDSEAYSISIFTRNEGVKWNVHIERKE